jgi:acyl dehydratase
LKYDPQPFHLDSGAAAESIYGGLIASGFQMVSLCFRLLIQQSMLAESSMGPPGLDDLRWLAPVRPGDTLRTEVEVLYIAFLPVATAALPRVLIKAKSCSP